MGIGHDESVTGKTGHPLSGLPGMGEEYRERQDRYPAQMTGRKGGTRPLDPRALTRS